MSRYRTLRAGLLVVGALAVLPAHAAVSPLELVEPIVDYKLYVSERLQDLVDGTRAFVEAVKAGDLARAQRLYAPARQPYEAAEPIAELFSDLDAAIDARADDYELGEKDPAFSGFHRLEYGLFALQTTEGLAPWADKLMADVLALQARVQHLTFPPAKVVGGAAALMEEVAATKVSGEEDRYSHTDLWDLKGNVEGARKIVELLRPLIARQDAVFARKVDENFDAVEAILAKYRDGDGFVSYERVTERDRRMLVGLVNVLAEDLSTLRGMLGVD
jgi:Predicted periplasmic lipoprotein involved in iron transport